MRLLHICVNGPVSDGLTYQENLLSKYHKKLGYDVYMLAPMWCWDNQGKLIRANQSRYINSDGVKMIRLEMNGRDDFSKTFKSFVGLYDALEEIDPEIVFIHSCAFIDIKTIVKYLKSHRTVIVFADNHADFSNSATNWVSRNILYKIIWKHYAQKLIPYTKKFYGVLPARVDFIVDMYGLPKDKCFYLPMGADDELVEYAENPYRQQETREKYGINDSDFLIVTGGKIDPWKKQTIDLMRAVRSIGDENIKLVVFGSIDPTLKDDVTELVDNQRIKYAGWQDSKGSYELFAISDLVVFPGRHSVYWEQAVGQGKPVVVKDWQGTHHVDLGGNVLYLKEDSAEEMKSVILNIYSNSELYQSMKEIAVSKGKNYFSYKHIAERCVN